MRMLFLTAGTRGDIEPFAALARAALAAGHDVTLAVPDNPGVDLSGLQTTSLGIDFAQLIQERGSTALAAARAFRTRIRPGMRRMFTEAARVVQQDVPDVVVHHPKVLTAPHAAAAAGVPHLLVEAVPSLSPTSAFPLPGFVSRDLGPFNRATWRAASAAGWVFARDVQAACAATGLSPSSSGSRGRPTPAAASLIPVSPHLLPRPGDWPEHVVLTGTWAGPGGSERLPQQIAEFVAGGPFLYAGFGSMASGDPRSRTRAVVEAARAHGLRVLLATGWGGLDLPDDVSGDDVLAVPSVPHRAVLPHASVAVHHGGAGTVHAVAAAGVSQVVVPFTGDQPFWARTLHRAHLAARPVPVRQMTTARLRRAIEQALPCTPVAQQIAHAMSGEDGLRHALQAIETIISNPERPLPVSTIPARRDRGGE